MNRSNASGRGFTMVELLVVLAILSILAAIAMKTFGNVKEKGRLRMVETAISEMENALSKYSMEHGGKFPGLKQVPFGGGGGWIRYGPAITGGSPGPVDDMTVLNQDDYLEDMKAPDSPYRTLPGQNPVGGGGQRMKLKAADELYRENLYRYIDDPYENPGDAMVNVAYIEYEHNIQTNDFRWVFDIQDQYFGVGSGYDGLAPGFPRPGGFYSIEAIWDPADPATYANYPEGHFAYIPLKFTTESGQYAEGYWLIGYGDDDTLVDSSYNVLLRDPNWPNFEAPFGDGDASTPPLSGSFEETVRLLMTGALVVKANIYQDQLSGLI